MHILDFNLLQTIAIVSSLKKGNLVFFERAPLLMPGIEPGAACTKVNLSSSWAINACLQMNFQLDKV